MFDSCISKIYFPKSTFCQGERDKRYNSGGSISITSERVKGFYLCYPRRRSLFSPTSGGSGGIFKFLGVHWTTSRFDQKEHWNFGVSVLSVVIYCCVCPVVY